MLLCRPWVFYPQCLAAWQRLDNLTLESGPRTSLPSSTLTALLVPVGSRLTALNLSHASLVEPDATAAIVVDLAPHLQMLNLASSRLTEKGIPSSTL